MSVAVSLDAEEFIPHRAPMRWIDTLVECGDGHAVVEARVAEDGPLVDDEGLAEEAGLLELMAQACAAMRGYEDRAGEGPVRSGFLVGVRTLKVHGPAWAGDLLRIRVRTVASLEGFTVAEAEVARGEDLLATGTLKLWVTDEPPPQKDRGARGAPR